MTAIKPEGTTEKMICRALRDRKRGSDRTVTAVSSDTVVVKLSKIVGALLGQAWQRDYDTERQCATIGMTMNYRERIVRDPGVVGGEPVLKGTRVTLRTVLASLAEGATTAEILADFPTLCDEDVRAAIAFAATSAEEDLPVAESPIRGELNLMRICPRLVSELQALGHDIDTVRSEQLAGRDDDEVWQAAQAADRF